MKLNARNAWLKVLVLVAICVAMFTPIADAAAWVQSDRNWYAPHQSIVVSYSDFPGYSSDWITVVRSSAPANEYGEWYYTNGNRSGSMNFKGLPPGSYEVRGYFNWDGTSSYTIQASYSFTVGGNRPAPGVSIVRTSQSVYAPYQGIVVNYSGFPGYDSDWITVVRYDAPVDEYGEWYYTNGNRAGSMSFKGLPPGDYEVRAYFNWSGTGTYVVQGRQGFSVR